MCPGPRFRVVVCCALALLYACGSDSGTTLGPTTFNVSGDWYWEELPADSNAGVFCFDSGGVRIAQNGPRFSAAGLQTGSCAGPAGTQVFSDSFQVSAGTIEGTTAHFRIEPCPYSGTLYGSAPDSVEGTVVCTLTQQGVTVNLRGTWRLLRDRPDLFPPVVSGSVSGSFTPTFYFLGDTLHISVNATEDRDLRFIGYRLTGPAPRADSIPASGTSASASFTLPVTAAMAGSSILTLFARDRTNVGTADLGTVMSVAVHGRRTRAVSLSSAALDLVGDGKRARVYLSMFGMSQVAVLDPATATLGAPITLPGVAGGLDLTPGGDSLLVALENRGSFAVVNLVNGAIDTVHLDFNPTMLNHPGSLRVAGDGRVFVVGTDRNVSGAGAQLVSYDLGTGTQQRRVDVGAAGSLASYTLLARADDRSRVLLLEAGACCPVKGQVYSASSGTFGPSTGTISYAVFSISASTPGDRFLVDTRLFAGDLSPADSVSDPDRFGADPTVISADASRAYLATTSGSWPGFVVRRVADNVLLEQDYVPGWGTRDRLALLPDGVTLIGYVGTGSIPTPQPSALYLVDLR